MKSLFLFIFLFFGILVFVPTDSQAQSAYIKGFGGAGIGAKGDLNAVGKNPASLSSMKDYEILGFYGTGSSHPGTAKTRLGGRVGDHSGAKTGDVSYSVDHKNEFSWQDEEVFKSSFPMAASVSYVFEDWESYKNQQVQLDLARWIGFNWLHIGATVKTDHYKFVNGVFNALPLSTSRTWSALLGLRADAGEFSVGAVYEQSLSSLELGTVRDQMYGAGIEYRFDDFFKLRFDGLYEKGHFLGFNLEEAYTLKGGFRSNLGSFVNVGFGWNQVLPSGLSQAEEPVGALNAGLAFWGPKLKIGYGMDWVTAGAFEGVSHTIDFLLPL